MLTATDCNGDTLQEFLELYPPDVKAIVLKLRSIVAEVLPGTQELIDLPSRLIAYRIGSKMADVVCTIMPYRDHVNLGLYRAVDLPDPQNILEGTGKVHRHVKVRSIADAENPALRELLLAALKKKYG